MHLVTSAVLLSMHPLNSAPPIFQDTKDPSAALWRPVFAAVLQLACDIESVVVKLFEPLMMQLIRWVSGNHGVPAEVQKTIFDCILSELINSESSSLRKLSARCVAEIFRWGAQETSTKALESDPDNSIAILLQRTCSLAIHPDKYRRLGAAMVINSIYRGFRENKVLVSK
jgi:DNA-dependent protein kinase catalytic subunit